MQLTGDGEAVVFHDFTLERLTGASGRLDAARTSDLTATVLRSGPDRITTLPDFLAMIGGRTPLICEIKSRFDGDPRLAERVARCAATYAGPMCIESFDPRIMAHLRRNRTVLNIAHVPLGMVAQASYDDPRDEWAHLDPGEKHALAQFLHFADTRPDFLSFGVRDLPHAVPTLCRMGLDMPVTSWTVRTPQQRRLAERHADQIVFEGDVFA